MPIKGTFTGAADVVVDTLVDVQVRTLAPIADGAAQTVAPVPAPEGPAPARPSMAPAQTPITQT